MNELSNTWEYRFAFRIRSLEDAPLEFQSAFRDLTQREGDPVLAFFSPAVQDGHFLMSRWTPPRLWLVFRDSLALLSLDHKSDAVSLFQLRQEDFVGFGRAEFLLNCWFSVYPGTDDDAPIEVRFPSRAEEKYQDLAKVLIGWLEGEVQTGVQRGRPEQHVKLAGLPPKFARLIEQHPELGEVLEMFYQPRMVFGGRKGAEWSNLLLLLTSRAIVALTDQCRNRWSEYGFESLYFPFARVKLADWIETRSTDRGAIRICLGGINRHANVSWSVSGRLKPYALRWVWAVESNLRSRQQDRTHAGTVRSPGTQAVRCEA